MDAQDYQYLPTDQIQCPKCGQLDEIPLYSNSGYSLEYAGVCQSRLETGALCGATLWLKVTAHLFPRPESS